MLMAATSACHAVNAHVSMHACSFSVSYTESVQSGDAVVFSMTFDEQEFLPVIDDAGSRMVLVRNSTGKSPGSSALFTVRGSPLTLYGAIPLSSWLEQGSFTLHVTFRFQGDHETVINLPVEVREKIFNEEVLHLDARNTAIKSDTSPQRAAQIDRLNAILGTTDPEGVWWDGTFIRPCLSERMTAYFGDRRTYAYNTGRRETSLHYGNDYGIPEGTEVYACARGKVVLAESRVSTGWSVVIEHLPGLYSLYYHMSELKVAEGDIVQAGQLIGLSGSTGLATGPHLHWELRLYSQAICPDQFIGLSLFPD